MKREQEPQNHIDPELKALASQPLTHDRLFREVFAWSELAEAFLRFVLPKKVLEKLDLAGLTVEPKDFLSFSRCFVFCGLKLNRVYCTKKHISTKNFPRNT